MSVKTYQLYCEICNWKMITDGNDTAELVESKTASIPRGIPHYDENKKIVTPKDKQRIKRFKCPKCGRVVRPRKIDNPQQKLNDKLEAEERERKRYEEESKSE